MIPAVVDLPNDLNGDTWCGVTFGPLQFNGGPPPASLDSCRLYFRQKAGLAFAYGFRSNTTEGFGAIEIVDPVNWEVQIPEQDLPLKAGDYLWWFKTVDANGVKRTLYTGEFKMVRGGGNDD